MEHPLFSTVGTNMKAQFSLLHFTVNESAGGFERLWQDRPVTLNSGHAGEKWWHHLFGVPNPSATTRRVVLRSYFCWENASFTKETRCSRCSQCFPL